MSTSEEPANPDRHARRDIIIYALCLSTCFIGICIYFIWGGGQGIFSQLRKMNQIESQLQQERKAALEETKD